MNYSILNQIKEIIGCFYVHKIIKYSVFIEDDELIDFIYFVLDNEIDFAIEISSTLEGINFITKKELEDNILRLGISYNPINLLSSINLLEDINYKLNDFDEVEAIHIKLKDEDVKIKLGSDCFIITQNFKNK